MRVVRFFGVVGGEARDRSAVKNSKIYPTFPERSNKCDLSCCASNSTINFYTILVGSAGEPVSAFNLDA